MIVSLILAAVSLLIFGVGFILGMVYGIREEGRFRDLLDGHR